MKIWQGHGSEHSYRLVLIGHFEDETAAAGVEDKIKRLQDAVPQFPEPDWNRQDDRFPDELLDLLNELKVWDLGRSEIQAMIYDFSVQRDGSDLTIKGNDAEIQGFVKLMIGGAAKIEIYSSHDFSQDGERKVSGQTSDDENG
jgi:hypothetical protein